MSQRMFRAANFFLTSTSFFVCLTLFEYSSFAQLSEFQFDRVVPIEFAGRQIHARLSPDGTRVVFSTRHKSHLDIFSANADGTAPIQLTRTPSYDSEPAWSPDGLRVIFSSNRTGDYQIFDMDADGSDVRQLTDESFGAGKPRYSSSGWTSWLVLHPRSGKINPANLVITKGHERRTINKAPSFIPDYSWSLDGNRICYATPGYLTFYELDSAKSQSIKLAEVEPRLFGHCANNITWSPDSDRVCCRISFLGGRAAGPGGGGMPEIFGDKELFMVSPDDGTIDVIEPDALDSYPLDWVRERFAER